VVMAAVTPKLPAVCRGLLCFASDLLHLVCLQAAEPSLLRWILLTHWRTYVWFLQVSDAAAPPEGAVAVRQPVRR
jgi:hypothetical protein